MGVIWCHTHDIVLNIVLTDFINQYSGVVCYVYAMCVCFLSVFHHKIIFETFFYWSVISISLEERRGLYLAHARGAMWRPLPAYRLILDYFYDDSMMIVATLVNLLLSIVSNYW